MIYFASQRFKSKNNDILITNHIIKQTIYRIKGYYTGGGLNRAY